MSNVPRTLSSSSLLSENDDVVEGYSIYSVSESLDDSLGSDCPVLSPRGGGDPSRPFEVRVEELLRQRAQELRRPQKRARRGDRPTTPTDKRRSPSDALSPDTVAAEPDLGVRRTGSAASLEDLLAHAGGAFGER
mmetsp:Transcript_8202/g.24567  ORF Transcript_8202/g.24567 Transcript_8202/m.24567 type:complete len:135 (-) Transcript_8202:100-504(-)